MLYIFTFNLYLYSTLNDLNVEPKESDYTENFKNVLNEEYSDYKNEGKIITQKEMNNLIAVEMKNNK